MGEIVIPYVPRGWQLHCHEEMERRRWSHLVVHRRAGKTVMLVNHLIKQALTEGKSHARYAYVAPFLKQAKSIAWDYLLRFTDPIPKRKVHESELRVDLINGARVQLFGADNSDGLLGMYLDGLVLDEYARMSPRVFTSVFRPMLSDREGWCVFSSTPNGRNHFWELGVNAVGDESWFRYLLKASESALIPEDELEQARLVMSPQEYLREFECSFDVVIGKQIYPEWNEDIHGADVDLTPAGPVEVWRGWDNTGLSPAIVMLYVDAYGAVRVFKEFCFKDTGVMEAAEAMLLWCGRHLHPGCSYVDIADPAGRIRDTAKMSSREYVIRKAREMGCDICLVDGVQTWKVRRESVAQRLRRLPPMQVSRKGCPTLVAGFGGGYAYEEIPSLPGQYYERPVKNHYSHIHDALQYAFTRMFMTDDAVDRAAADPASDDAPRAQWSVMATEGRNQVTGY